MSYPRSSPPAAPSEDAPAADPPSDADVRNVLENGVREISGEVRNSLDFHRSQDGGGEVSHVVLSGAAQDIPGFAEALQASLGVEVRTADRRASPMDGSADVRLPAPARGRRRARRHGGAAMRAVNLIPATSAAAAPSAPGAPRRRLRGARAARGGWRCSR